MKIVCPSCGTENTVSKEAADSAGGGLVDVSCQKCGSILPAVSSRDVLNELRDELADEVGELFTEAPQREVQTSTMLIGGSEETPLSSPNLQSPAFAVHDGASAESPVPEQAAADLSDSQSDSEQTQKDESSEQEPETWSPSAAGLDSLISEEFENAAARKSPESEEDKLLRPPEIKKKPALEHTPSPAFDADFLTDPELRQARSDAPQGPLVVNNPSVITEAPRRNSAVVILITLAIVAVLGMLAVIIVLLIKPTTAVPAITTTNQSQVQQTDLSANGQKPAGQVQTGQVPTAQALPINDAGTKILDSSAPTNKLTDNAKPSEPAQQQNVQNTGDQTKLLAQNTAGTNERHAQPIEKKHGLSDKLFDDEDPAPAKEKNKTSHQVSGKNKTGKKHLSSKNSNNTKNQSKKPSRSTGKRPKGCDPLIYPDPMECPHAAPPGKSEILAVVRAHLGEVDACAKKQFAVDPALASGTIMMRFWIRPTGKTAKVAVLSQDYKNSVVGKCLTKKISAWDFGTFDGRKIGPIKFPFRLHTQ